MSPRPLIIDCDPGQDDAVALLMALASRDELDVLGICAVAGNVPLSLTELNARRVRTLAGREDVPVFAGCPRPLVRLLETAEHIHGESGIEGAELPDPGGPLQPEHAVDWLIDTLRKREGITLATLGPLTNLAVAIVKAPDIVPRIREVVVMGGAMDLGNVTPAAEFNVYADPHAAHVVFEAGLRLTMIGLHVTHQVVATPERIMAIQAIDNPVAKTLAGMIDFYARKNMAVHGHAGAPLHDPCVIAHLLNPTLFQGAPMRVDIEIASELTIGRTVCDPRGKSAREPNVTVLQHADPEGFFSLLGDRLGRYSV